MILATPAELPAANNFNALGSQTCLKPRIEPQGLFAQVANLFVAGEDA